MQAASLYENLVGLHKRLPIDPKAGTVPPSISSS
jgi:amidase